VASKLLKTGNCCHIRTLGVTRYGDSGSSSDVLSAMALDPEDLAAAVRSLMAL
jgi:transketolase C-terminal domain/subunit